MKCKHCKKDFEENQLIKVKGSGYYCEDCYYDYYVPEYVDHHDLINSLVEMIGSDSYDGMFVSRYIKGIRKKYNCTNLGMKLTFEFMYKIMGKCNKGLFPKYEEFNVIYNKTSKFYKSLDDMSDTLEEITNVFVEPSYIINDNGELVVTFSKIK